MVSVVYGNTYYTSTTILSHYMMKSTLSCMHALYGVIAKLGVTHNARNFWI